MNDSDSQAANASERLQAKTVYAVIQREGERELERPPASLWWSGIIAGIAISSSVVTQGILHAELPESEWRWMIVNLGYCIGFVIVILGRLQLFTENTITPVLPIMADFSFAALRRMMMLWAVVLAANLAGTLVAALFADVVAFTTPEQLTGMLAVARHAVYSESAYDVLLHAIPAGFYVAAIVWMLPSSKGFELWIVVIMTYLIAIGGFAHVIVGAMECFLLMLEGELGVLAGIGSYLLPALVGNIIGGTALFSLLAYAQVREEIR